MNKQEIVLKALKNVIYPEKNQDLVSLGMVKKINIDDNTVTFTIVLPSKNNPFKKSLDRACRQAIHSQIGKNIDINIMYETNVPKIQQSAGFDAFKNVKNILVVASGKGGVGKSTIAVNLAVALAQQGLKTGLIDADIFGPSIPKMFGEESARPYANKINGKEIIIPIEKYGVKMLSIGFFTDPENAVIWRGPMASNALKQIITEADWGELDYLLIDLPPGTSDIHLTVVQSIAVTGAIIVSTPQEIALADAMRGISMFKNPKIDVPIIGLIENMAWFTPAELPENKYFIFGKDGVKNTAKKNGIALLGQIPIVQSICEQGDKGEPSALDGESITGKAFAELAETTIAKTEERNKTGNPSQKVKMNKK